MVEHIEEKIPTHFPANSKNLTFEYILVDDLDNWLGKEISSRKRMLDKKQLTPEGIAILGTLIQLRINIGRYK